MLHLLRRHAAPPIRVHDYTDRTRTWGHDYTLTPDADPTTARIGGHGTGLRKDDFLRLSHPQGGEVIYQIIEIEYCWNPLDQWFARVRFVPGSSDLGQRVEAAVTAVA
jgi:hypothetical protein